MTRRPVRFALVGAGDRGHNTYGAWCLAHPDRARVVAVAEPIAARREAFAVVQPRRSARSMRFACTSSGPRR